jgi:hypothetical protein
MKKQDDDEMPEDEMPGFLLGELDEMESQMNDLAKYAANFEALSADSKAAIDKIVSCTAAGDQDGFYDALNTFKASARSSYFDARSRR